MFIEKHQSRPSGIHLSGVSPYNGYKHSKNIDNELGSHPQLGRKTEVCSLKVILGEKNFWVPAYQSPPPPLEKMNIILIQ